MTVRIARRKMRYIAAVCAALGQFFEIRRGF
jgi:hypothetical protein